MPKKRSRKKKKQNNVKYFDYSLLFFLFLLLGIGLVMLYSTSAYTATLKTGDSAYYLKRQIMAAGIGFVGLFFASNVDYHLWKKFTVGLYVASLVLCIYVQFFGTSVNNSSRWINIGGIQFQPSEFAKIAVILTLSSLICDHQEIFRNNRKMLLTSAIFVGPIFGAVAVNNLSTAMILAGIAFVMLFVANPNYKIFLGMIGMLGVAGALLMVLPGMSYRFTRIQVWLHPEENPDDAYQTLQGLYAIGSGGLFGKGLGESTQKLGFVPEAQNDMIFSIICEELGLFGAICIITLYILLLWRCLLIALNAKDKFGSFLVIGIMTHISLQVLMNIAVVTNTMPNTGVTLPFISYGGTSIMILIGEIGVVLGVSRSIKYDEELV